MAVHVAMVRWPGNLQRTCRGKRDGNVFRRRPLLGRRAVPCVNFSSEELNLSAHVVWFEAVAHELKETDNFPD